MCVYMRAYTREDVYMSACEHMWGAFLGEYDDLDKREALGAGVQCRHTHKDRWVLMRISICAGGPRSFILQTLMKHLQCARRLCWGWEVRREKMWFLPLGAYCLLGRQTTQCRHVGYSVVRKLTEGAQEAVEAPGVHPNQAVPSLGQETLELSLEG